MTTAFFRDRRGHWRRRCVGAIVLLCLTGCSASDPPRVSPPDGKVRQLEPGLLRLLAHHDPQYDPDRGMLRVEFRSLGYHSRMAAGTPVHPTRESLIYALALLQRDAGGDRQRAIAIVQAVLALQDRAAESATCGVWPWLAEEPLTEMDPPDLNWADFCGASLVQMLIEHAGQLPVDVQSEMRASVRLAAEAIRRRNVGSGYTNIAVLGGGVCAASGELLNDSGLLDYGRQRLAGVVDHAAHHGSFTEYNSPSYLKVVIGECERTLQMVRDEATLRSAESLRRTAWQIVAESFHPPTQQWAGPHARTSRDRLRRSTVDFLVRRVGIEIAAHPAMEVDEVHGYEVVQPLSCPQELVSFFSPVAVTDTDAEPRVLRRVFERGKTDATNVAGTTWLGPVACLGSVTRSSLWTQRKPVIGYWRTPQDPAVVFRLRFLHDGRDFASMGLFTGQQDRRILSVLSPLTGKGDWHLRLDRPPGGQFVARDFRLRFELSGTGVQSEQLSEGRYALTAGDYRMVIHPTPSQFADTVVAWELGQEGDEQFLDGICYRGAPKSFQWDSVVMQLAVGLELLKSAEQPSAAKPHWQATADGKLAAVWNLPDLGTNLLVRPGDIP